MPNLLYSLHDRDAHPLVPAGGWCVESIALSENPQPTNWTQIRGDINWILRLNFAHNGRDGTIPLRGQYDEFAKRCADYMAATKGVNVVIIANEPNHKQEYPNGAPISPEDYADCFNLCYQAITFERPDLEVITAAVAPWDITSGIDWLAYYKRMLAGVTECDGLAVHGYTHGADPNLIWSAEKVQGWYWHFPVIYQTIQAIPSRFAERPVHVTETDQGDDAWLDANSGWVQNAYQSVDEHNRTPGTQKIHSLALYRWRGDKYQIYNKPQVQADFRAAVSHRYLSPGVDPMPPQPQPPQPQPPQPTPEPEPARDIDPRLVARGVKFDFVKVPAGQGYWRMTKAQWLDHAAQQVGPDHHILGRVLKENIETAGVPLHVEWPSGSTIVVSKRDDPNATYNYDYGMGPSLKEYSIAVSDGNPSDQVSGIGMGKDGNPREHTSTWLNFEWTISEGITPPLPPTPLPRAEILVWPVVGPITQHFGEGPAQFGQQGHNGIDIAVSLGTPVAAIADGVVMYTGFDEAGYGNYVRVYHASIHSHSFYAHLAEIGVQVGQPVKQGDRLGASGSTGNSTGPHVHFELRAGNQDAYYQGVTFGYTQGRYNPADAYVVTGSPLQPGAERFLAAETS
jgi:hypothetical protein